MVGHVIVLPEYVAEVAGGHLWWTRSAPFQEIPSLTVVLLDGARTDEIWIHSPELEAELEHWARDEMLLQGEVLATRWLGASESLQDARREFGVEGFDDSGQVIWKPSPDKELS